MSINPIDQAQFRSIDFNINDEKNQTFYRKYEYSIVISMAYLSSIIDGAILPAEIATLTSDVRSHL